ncbi:tRNA wybutosine-synthesizing protein 5 [Denticeps clupeoides]|nr:tRNA wybutosine-synthesizing protein 5 [Denticeps clupeoides]XP_028847100.1 tRNA wybutosine-synthesizing protein 5 [Denticeps clupeoides]XP_028847102.1 tRNA wybutosine-synthesizing protein 5 [Denticeps clupeoides]
MEKQEKFAVPVYTGVDRETFTQHIYPLRHPALLKDVPIGPCLEKWTVDYLCKKGGGREVKVHVSPVAQLDFLHKNFLYRTLPFDKFVGRAAEAEHSEFFVCEDESYYLRSLGEDLRKEPADIKKQFPDLAEDFHLPRFFEAEQFFSSVFRISSCGLQLWTHYDVMDNLLAQVTGRKRVVLYSPQDAPYLYLSGDKSEILDVDSPDLEKYAEFVKARRYECVLEPGDLLFIPALWFHNTVALTFGVGVNVFWCHLSADCYDKKDPYGNKDPIAAQRAMQVLERALGILEELPSNYRDFYARRMVLRIQNRAYSSQPEGPEKRDSKMSIQLRGELN